MLACFGFSPRAQAVITDPEDCFPGGNTAAGEGALLNLKEGVFNAAFGWFSLNAVIAGGFNTALGAGTLAVNTGENNTATGAAALLGNTTGATTRPTERVHSAM